MDIYDLIERAPWGPSRSRYPYGHDVDNGERADRAALVLLAYEKSTNFCAENTDAETNLKDLLTDLHHYVARYPDLALADLLSRAEDMYVQEVAEEDPDPELEVTA